MVMAKKPATMSSTDTCTSKSAGKRLSDSSAQTATIATGRITKNEDNGTPSTSPKRSEPAERHAEQEQAHEQLACQRQERRRARNGEIVRSLAGLRLFEHRTRIAPRQGPCGEGSRQENRHTHPHGRSQANADVAPCTTNASGTSTPAWAEDNRDAAIPAVRTHQARPIANAHDVSTSNDALPTPAPTEGRNLPP